MKIGCSTVNFRELTLKDALRKIKDAGYKYIETQANVFCPHVDVDNDNPIEFKTMIKEYGFKGVTALWATHGAIIPDEKSVEYGKKCIKWAKKANTPMVIMSDGGIPQGMNEDDAFTILKERLNEILKVATKNKTYLAIEPHGHFSLTAGGLKKIMSISDSGWLVINYDAANIKRGAYVESRGDKYYWIKVKQEMDEVEILSDIIKWVKHVHMKDIINGDCTILGNGRVDLKGCMKVLKENGYDGPLSVETEGKLEAGKDFIEKSRRFISKIWREI